MVRSINPLYKWICDIKSVKNIDTGDARPLYGYRISDVEFGQLKNLLKHSALVRSGSSVNKISYSSELFTFYASEWLRRYHTEGNPSWKEITDSLGWPTFSNPHITKMVGDGLRYWRRPLRKKGINAGYLHTLACEGGLPIRMMENQSGSLTRFFRRILTVLRTQISNQDPFTIAEQEDDCLPLSMRNDLVYEIAGEFCSTLNQLLVDVGASGGDKLEKLRSAKPLWFESLPLVLSEEHAEKLFEALFERSSSNNKVRNTVSVVRRWQQGEDCWYCDARIKFPLKLSQDQIAQLFELGKNPVGSRLVINGQWSGGNQPLALLSLNSNDEWMVEAYPVLNKVISGASALGEFSLSLQEGQTTLAEDIIPYGGAELPEALPWVMESLNDSGTELKLLGSGSLCSTQESVYVALPPSSMLVLPSAGMISVPRFIDDCQRTLLEVSGDYQVTLEDGAECLIKTGHDEDQSSHYVIRGSKYLNIDAKYPVHKGFPTLIITDGEFYQVVPAEELSWRTLKSGNKTWYKRTEREPLGLIELRHQVGNEVKHSTKLAVISPVASVELCPSNGREGQIKFSEIGNAEIYSENQGVGADLSMTKNEVLSAQGPRQVSLNNRPFTAGYSYTLDCVSNQNYPGPLKLKIQWASGNILPFTVPFPVEGGRFIGPDNQAFDSGSSSISRLQGIRAEVLELRPSARKPDIRLEAGLCADGLQLSGLLKLDLPLQRSEGSTLWTAPLVKKHHLLKALLSCSSDLDASIKLSLLGNVPDSTPSITLRRYDCQFIMKEGRLLVDDDNVTSLNSEERDRLVVQAISLGSPSAGPELLHKDEQGYGMNQLDDALGPWLVWGVLDGVTRVRPTFAKSFKGAEPQTLFQRATNAIDASERESLFEEYLSQLAKSPASQEWFEFINYLLALQQVPAAALDIYTVMLRQPRTMLTLLINTTLMGHLEFVWALQDELPFNWAWFEIGDWLTVIDDYSRALKEVFPEETPIEGVLQSLSMFVSQIQNKVVQDIRIKTPIDLIIKYLGSNGVQTTEISKVTAEQLDKARQNLARSFDSWGWINAKDAAFWGTLFPGQQNALVNSAMYRQQYNKPVELLLNSMVAAAAMTVFGSAGLAPFSKPFELIYQHAPEQLGTVFHVYQQLFWENQL